MPNKTRAKAEFGDFQTPPTLAEEVLQRVAAIFERPGTVVEPTCGVGNFLAAAHGRWGIDTDLVGIELNGTYLELAARQLKRLGRTDGLRLLHQDFFDLDWTRHLDGLEDPVLIVGNPPWVTNAELGALDSSNLPPKRNIDQQRGIDAITGSANFDISEWMASRLLEVLQGRRAGVALLLKTAVARKLLLHAWTTGLDIDEPCIYRIDAKAYFNASVDACLFTCRTGSSGPQQCPVFDSLGAAEPSAIVGMSGDALVADLRAFKRTRHLVADNSEQWRSGVKHDNAKVLELHRDGDRYRNGHGQDVDVEDRLLFPLLKSSDVAKGIIDSGRHMLVTQHTTGEDTGGLAETAPKTWRYLSAHADAFDRRKSSIYRGRPPFSIFGVGRYTFAPWKVAISGFYKNLRFLLVPPLEGKPVLFDDTVYFTPCWSEREARLKFELLDSSIARDFLLARVFLDSKRPVTSKLLGALSIERLAHAVGRQAEYAAVCAEIEPCDQIQIESRIQVPTDRTPVVGHASGPIQRR